MVDEVQLPPDQTAAERAVNAKDKPWIIVFGLSLLFLIGLWLWMTPDGWWEKLRLFGYAVCHQMEERSFHAHGLSSPLCARCTGMYLGAVLTIAYQAFQGRRGRFPKLWVSIILGLFLICFGLDGVNSFLWMIPSLRFGYEPSNLLRLITGTGVGLGIGSILAPLFNQSVWRDWINRSFYEKWFSFPLLLVFAGIMVAGVFSESPFILLPAMFISALSVVFLLGSLWTVVAVMLLGRLNRQRHWKELALPILIGLNICFGQIILTSWGRFLLTGTWAPLHL